MHKEDNWLEALYRETFPQVAMAIQRRGGDLDTAKDLFHDALIIYLEKKKDPSFNIQVSEKAYLIGITKILWVRKYKSDQRHPSVNIPDHAYTIPEDLYPEEDSEMRVYDYIKAAGQKCMQLLQAFYYDRLSMQEVAERFSYKSTRSATVQKYKCLEKIRDHIKQADHEKATV